jgi:uracil-DNA glycosylase
MNRGQAWSRSANRDDLNPSLIKSILVEQLARAFTYSVSQGRTAPDLIRQDASLADLKAAVQLCQGCDIWQRASQAVFGEGNDHAEVMLIGEQPGNREDIEGRPFVGPAGRLLDEALEQAGILREKVYVTNIVKHFNSTQRGKFRIHKKPNAREIAACRPWIDAEIQWIRPKAIICLGATAAQALVGTRFRVSRDRGKLINSNLAPLVIATVHPSSILRAPDSEARHAEWERFVNDLKRIAQKLPPSALAGPMASG